MYCLEACRGSCWSDGRHLVEIEAETSGFRYTVAGDSLHVVSGAHGPKVKHAL